MSSSSKALLEKIAELPAERITEIENFVDFIRLRDEMQNLRWAITATNVPAFATVWNNPEDDVYDTLAG
jgi:hypothetical protein